MSLVSDVVTAPISGPLRIIKIVGATVLAVVFLAMAGATYFMYNEMTKATAKQGELAEQVKGLQSDLKLAQIGQLAFNAGQTLSNVEKEELDKKARETRNKLKSRESEIDKLNASAADKARLKSEARMSSVWDMFCHIQPENAICKPLLAPQATDAQGQQTQAQEPVQ